jgi:ATP-dependent DNA ligase
VRYADHVNGSGREFFRLAWERDLEGIVAKWKFGTYRSDRAQTSWVKTKNATYLQAEGRPELFEKRRPKSDRTKWVRSDFPTHLVAGTTQEGRERP